MTAPPTGHPLDLDAITDELVYRLGNLFNREQVAAAVAAARQALQPQATITTYLPLLITRYATERLTAAAQADGLLVKTVPEVLFLCVQNAGRSQMAAAIADHLAGGRVHVRSAGSHPTDQINPTAIQVLAEIGINLTDAYPKPLSGDVVHAADIIITMGCGDTCPVFSGKRYLDWDVADPADQPVDIVRNIRDDLARRITQLLNELN